MQDFRSMHLNLMIRITNNNKWRWVSDTIDKETSTLWTVSLMTLKIKITTVLTISKSLTQEIVRLLVNKIIALLKVKTYYHQRWVTEIKVKTFSRIFKQITTPIVKDLRINLSCRSHLNVESHLHLIMTKINKMNTLTSQRLCLHH